MRMTSEGFHTWSQHLGLSPETESLIASIRSSRPVRRVSGRAGNITGRYPSPKMGVSIQFESERVEFWAIYGMERDEDVLEFYEQPSRIPLNYRARSGHRTTQWHTPDFFVLRRESTGWEEWKQASSLDRLATEKPARYQQAGTGQWHCPPGKTYAEHLGLTYRLRSSVEFHPLEIQNLKFLQDFWAHEVPPQPEQEALALAHILAHPGIPLSELLATYPNPAVDIIWVLLSTHRVFTDLSATLLMRHEQVTLYAEERQVPQVWQEEPAHLSTPLPDAPVAWDGRLWRIEGWGEMVQLRPEVGEPLAMPQAEFEHLKQEGSLWVVGSASPSPMTPEVRELLAQAGSKAQRVANQRMIYMLAYARGEPTTASRRSAQSWWKAYQQARERYDCGYVGLLDRVAARGNRTQRIEPASLQLLEAALQEHYAAPQGKSAAAVYRLYREQLEWLKSLSNRTHVLYVLAGPYTLFGFRNTSGRLARRGRDIHFARYHVEHKEERIAFVAAVKYLLERVPLEVDLKAHLARWRWFAEGSIGCIEVLKDWLVDAVAATLVQNRTSLTEDILTRTMPHPARRLSLEMEARAGEHKEALHDSESAKQFQALVKKSAKAANGKTELTSGSIAGVPSARSADEIAKPASATLPMPQVAPKPSKPCVGQRAPERDPVGGIAASSVRKAIGYSFTEEIPVTLAQMREAGVSRFECPTCLAVREIKPKGDHVEFPWHSKRTTNTPHQGTHWVKRESTWKPCDA